MQALTNISNTMEMTSSMSVLRTKMMGEGRVLKAEIATDSKRGMDVTAKVEQLSDTNSAIGKLTGNQENKNTSCKNCYDSRKKKEVIGNLDVLLNSSYRCT